MDAIMEVLFTIAAEIVGGMNFKRPKTRTRAMTVIFALFFGMVSVLIACDAMMLFREGSITVAIVIGVIALAVAVVGAIVIIRGHKTNWKE